MIRADANADLLIHKLPRDVAYTGTSRVFTFHFPHRPEHADYLQITRELAAQNYHVTAPPRLYEDDAGWHMAFNVAYTTPKLVIQGDPVPKTIAAAALPAEALRTWADKNREGVIWALRATAGAVIAWAVWRVLK